MNKHYLGYGVVAAIVVLALVGLGWREVYLEIQCRSLRAALISAERELDQVSVKLMMKGVVAGGAMAGLDASRKMERGTAGAFARICLSTPITVMAVCTSFVVSQETAIAKMEVATNRLRYISEQADHLEGKDLEELMVQVKAILAELNGEK